MKPWTLGTLAILAWASASPSFGADDTSPTPPGFQFQPMRPSPSIRAKWYSDYGSAPSSKISPDISKKLSGGGILPVPNLLDYITYTPSQRNQAACGNCWVWSGSALGEIKHAVDTGVRDPLSQQWFNSKFYTVPGGYYACNGGNLTTLVNFYNSYAWLPASNNNAQFQDQAGGSAPHVSWQSITTSPYYNGSVGSMSVATIPTTAVGQATAIANIKNVLNQRKAVQYAFWMSRQADWTAFNNFWNYQPETALWDPSPYCGRTTGADAGEGGHAVTVVGYDDTDPNTANHYWLILNSWGTTAQRPNGTFRLKMYTNYDCTDRFMGDTSSFYSLQFQNIETVAGKTPFINYNALNMATAGTSSNYLWNRSKGSTATDWSIWGMMDGQSQNSPAMATFNTRLYYALRNLGDNTIKVRYVTFDGQRSSWVTLPGASGSTPAMTVYRNRLWLFVKGSGNNNTYYMSMGTDGVWDANWRTIPSGTTPYAPSVVGFDSKLYAFVTGMNGRVYFTTMDETENWGSWYSLYWADRPMLTSAAPATTVYDGRIHVAVKGYALNGASDVNDTRVSIASQVPGSLSSWYMWSEVPGNGRTTAGPQVGVGPTPDVFTVSVSGSSASTMYSQAYTIGSGWAGSWTYIPGAGTVPTMGNYWFSPTPYVSSPQSTSILDAALTSP